MKTTIAAATLYATLSTGFIIAGCDAQDDTPDTETDAGASEDQEDRVACVFPTNEAPEPDPRYLTRAGISSGGCDLVVIPFGTQNNFPAVEFTFEAVADSPISARNAFVWASRWDAGVMIPWQRFAMTSGSWTVPEVGYCDAARTQPCVYRTRGHLELPEDEEFSMFRVGLRVLDDEGDPVPVTFDAEW